MQSKWIPYGRQCVDDEDIEAVARALRSDWLTTGPEVEAFEQALAEACEAKYAVVLNSGTAALHAAYFAADVGPGDEVLATPLTFAATANAALYLGATVVFADVAPDTGNLDPAEVRVKITERTKVVAAVDYAGHPAELDEIMEIAHAHGALVVEDACHALGATYKGRPVGSIADMTVFSFHPVKHITTGEGGAVLTNDPALADRVRLFRNHGIARDRALQKQHGPWYYEMSSLGYNYRLSDIHAALGRSQLKKLPFFLSERRRIAEEYRRRLAHLDAIRLPAVREYVDPAWHLFVVRLQDGPARRRFVEALHAGGIGVQVHYIPVYRHPYYQAHPRCWRGACPNAEAFYETCINLPIFPGLSHSDIERICEVIEGAAS